MDGCFTRLILDASELLMTKWQLLAASTSQLPLRINNFQAHLEEDTVKNVCYGESVAHGNTLDGQRVELPLLTRDLQLQTTQGDLKVEIFCEAVPKTAEVLRGHPSLLGHEI